MYPDPGPVAIDDRKWNKYDDGEWHKVLKVEFLGVMQYCGCLGNRNDYSRFVYFKVMANVYSLAERKSTTHIRCSEGTRSSGMISIHEQALGIKVRACIHDEAEADPVIRLVYFLFLARHQY